MALAQAWSGKENVEECGNEEGWEANIAIVAGGEDSTDRESER